MKCLCHHYPIADLLEWLSLTTILVLHIVKYICSLTKLIMELISLLMLPCEKRIIRIISFVPFSGVSCRIREFPFYGLDFAIVLRGHIRKHTPKKIISRVII